MGEVRQLPSPGFQIINAALQTGGIDNRCAKGIGRFILSQRWTSHEPQYQKQASDPHTCYTHMVDARMQKDLGETDGRTHSG